MAGLLLASTDWILVVVLAVAVAIFLELVVRSLGHEDAAVEVFSPLIAQTTMLVDAQTTMLAAPTTMLAARHAIQPLQTVVLGSS